MCLYLLGDIILCQDYCYIFRVVIEYSSSKIISHQIHSNCYPKVFQIINQIYNLIIRYTITNKICSQKYSYCIFVVNGKYSYRTRSDKKCRPYNYLQKFSHIFLLRITIPKKSRFRKLMTLNYR